MILGKIAVHECAVAHVHQALLEQACPDAEDHPAHQLRMRRLSVEDAPGVEHAKQTPQPDLGRIRIDSHLREQSAVGILRHVLVGVARLDVGLGVKSLAADRVQDLAQGKAAIADRDAVALDRQVGGVHTRPVGVDAGRARKYVGPDVFAGRLHGSAGAAGAVRAARAAGLDEVAVAEPDLDHVECHTQALGRDLA